MKGATMTEFQDQISSLLADQVCWRAWRGYASAIFFELGGKHSYKPGGELRRGDFSICLDSCPWEIFKAGKFLVDCNSEFVEIEKGIQELVGQKILRISFESSDATNTLFFSNNLSVVVNFGNYKSANWSVISPDFEFVVDVENIVKSEIPNEDKLY
jgi:hypothetical protein